MTFRSRRKSQSSCSIRPRFYRMGEQWDGAGARLEQTLSASVDLNLGRAAFAEAVRQRPAQRILLWHETR